MQLRLWISIWGLFFATAAWAEQPLFRFDGFDYSDTDFSPEFQRNLYEIQTDFYRKLETLFEEGLLELHFKAEAERQKITLEAVAQAALQPPEPDEGELKAFYTANKARIPGEYEQVKLRLEQYLVRQAMIEKRAALVAELKKKDFQSLVPKPIAPYLEIHSSGFPVGGNPDAEIVIVEFADYQCPHCRDAHEIMKSLLEKYGDQIKLVYMDFPVNRSGISKAVAEAAACADKQGKFWEYHDLAFAKQKALEQDSPLALARELGLDEKALQTCLDTGEGQAKVARAMAEAKRLGINATPSFFIDGRPLHLFNLEQDLTAGIKEAIAKAK